MAIFFNKKDKEIETLKIKLSISNEEAINFKASRDSYIESLRKEVELHRKDNEEKDKIIADLNSKIDLLHKYYNMDEEPSQEIKTAMRIDERVHELELENIRLKCQLELLMRQDMLMAVHNYNISAINYIRQQSISNPYQRILSYFP